MARPLLRTGIQSGHLEIWPDRVVIQRKVLLTKTEEIIPRSSITAVTIRKFTYSMFGTYPAWMVRIETLGKTHTARKMFGGTARRVRELLTNPATNQAS